MLLSLPLSPCHSLISASLSLCTSCARYFYILCPPSPSVPPLPCISLWKCTAHLFFTLLLHIACAHHVTITTFLHWEPSFNVNIDYIRYSLHPLPLFISFVSVSPSEYAHHYHVQKLAQQTRYDWNLFNHDVVPLSTLSVCLSLLSLFLPLFMQTQTMCHFTMDMIGTSSIISMMLCLPAMFHHWHSSFSIRHIHPSSSLFESNYL